MIPTRPLEAPEQGAIFLPEPSERTRPSFDWSDPDMALRKSFAFYINNCDVLPDGQGTIFSYQDPNHGHYMFHFAADLKGNQYRWQEIMAQRYGERTVTEVKLGSKGQYEAWRATYAANGTLSSVAELADAEWRASWERMYRLATIRGGQTNIESRRDEQTRHGEELALLAVKGMVLLTVPKERVREDRQIVNKFVTDKGEQMAVIEVGLSEEKRARELDQRQKAQSRMGLVAIGLHPRPVGHDQQLMLL
ncbi:hypothetical protein HY218_00145 [Candidatus Saccharibacteria bacterium]|nr:hypothetical protein [Candidatus Saccharibacteria bacterium]